MLPASVAVPLKTAVSVWVAAASVLIWMAAMLVPLKVTAPSVVAPSLKVTVPLVGAAPLPAVMVAVKVTGWPYTGALVVAVGTAVRAVVVGAEFN